MPSFDISSNLDWQELDNAINQATKEVSQRFDFKGIKCEIKMDQKAKIKLIGASAILVVAVIFVLALLPAGLMRRRHHATPS